MSMRSAGTLAYNDAAAAAAGTLAAAAAAAAAIHLLPGGLPTRISIC